MRWVAGEQNMMSGYALDRAIMGDSGEPRTSINQRG